MADKSLCKIDGCGKRSERCGWCLAHYKRWHRHGDPMAGRISNGEPLRFYRDVVLTYDGDDCLIWPFARTTAGYGMINGRYVHRMACESEHGPAPTRKHQAAHSCGKGHLACVTKRHLSWKTHTENMADTLVHGTHNRGARQGQSKLAETDVADIRALKGTMLQREIAAKYGVCRETIGKIHRRKNWAWLK